MTRFALLPTFIFTILALGTSFSGAQLAYTFDVSTDIGDVAVPGSSEATESQIRVQGAGADIWGEDDAFHFRYSNIEGDFAITAHVASFEGPEEWGKAGLMVRAGTDAEADNVGIFVTVGGNVMTQYREVSGGETMSVGREPVSPHRWIRVVRRGNMISTYYSIDGEHWNSLDEVEHLFPTEVAVGLAVTSHAPGVVAQANFESVSVSRDLAQMSQETGRVSSYFLHVTDEELEIWRERSRNGPYRVEGDAGTNSPGDWMRIMRRADDFMDRPQWRHWVGNTTSSCYERGDRAPHDEPANHLRDAAFVYLVTQDTDYRDVVRKELVSLAREPGTDFTDENRWCLGDLGDGNPALEIVNWFSKMLVAYDYLGAGSFTEAERRELDAWFLAAARYFQREVDYNLDSNFVDRLGDDYRLTQDGQRRNESCDDTSHYDGWKICSLAKYYNNRRAAEVRFFALAGLKFEDQLLQDRAKRFVREWMMFSVYPDGVIGEFERWNRSLPDLGWGYASAMLGTIVTIADAFARTGDVSLYEYSTTEGLFGTRSESGRKKSLLLTIRTLQSYLLPDVKRYATERSSEVGDIDRRIDGKHAPANWYSAADVGIVPANLYYQDSEIHAIYTRTHPNVAPYPENVSQRGPDVPWTGDWGLFPGVLFMFGELEGVGHPYP